MSGAPDYQGFEGLGSSGSDFNYLSFIVRQALGRVSTMIPVKVVAVHGGGIGPGPTVDVLPLVNQTDGVGNSTPHNTVFGLPAFRYQAGDSVVIADPVVGDIGHIVVSHRDISSVKANKGTQANPGSFRRFNLADGVYHGCILNQQTPAQYVQFTSAGVIIADRNGNKIEMKAGSIDVTTTAFRVNGEVIAGFGGADQVSVQTHLHSDVQPGGSSSGAPVPGT